MNTSLMRINLRKTIIVILGVILIMEMTGCGKPTYKLEFDGYGFQSKKTEYHEGEKVTVTYDMIATDTDYNFYLDCDDVELKREWDSKNYGYTFSFTMPAHDVKISVSSRNTMYIDPDANKAPSETSPVEYDNSLRTDTWFCPECGQKNDMMYCTDCGLKKPD